MFPGLIILLLLAIFGIGILCFYNFYFKRRKLPPGPTPLPLIGNLHSIQQKMAEECLLEWRQKYGPMFTFWLGETPVVCLTEYNKIMETVQKDGETYSARFVHEELEILTKGGVYGVIMTDGDLWREQRRFALHVLRDFGLGKNLMQERMIQEIRSLFARMDAQIGQNVELDMRELLDIAVGSIINNLLFGYRFDNEHFNEFREVKGLLREMIQKGFHPLTVLFQHNPHLFRKLPFFSAIFDQIISVHRNFANFFDRQIRVHLKGIDVSDWETAPTDFVEAFLKEKARRDARGEEHNFTIEQLKGLCTDLWAAGQETTSTTLAWGIAYLIHHPQLQQNIQAELGRVIGSTDRFITVSDKANLPYTNAVICEVQRVSNLVAFNLLRKLTCDVTIDGYRLKKGTAICPQISAVLSDGQVFDQPIEFRPERFLDESGKLKLVKELIPFSIGKRQCLGESLARMELFLFLANLLNQYTFVSGAKAPSLKRTMGAAIQCPKFTCRVQKR